MAAGSGAYDFATFKLVSANAAHGWDSALILDRDAFLASSDSGEAAAHVSDALARIPHPVLRDGNWVLSIPPVGPDGFRIDMSKSGRPIRVFFDAFEQEFEKLEIALRWVERALSNAFQLRIISVGSKPREFRLEPAGSERGGVIPVLGEDLLVGGYVMFTPALFRRATTVIRRNGFPPR